MKFGKCMHSAFRNNLYVNGYLQSSKAHGITICSDKVDTIIVCRESAMDVWPISIYYSVFTL